MVTRRSIMTLALLAGAVLTLQGCGADKDKLLFRPKIGEGWTVNYAVAMNVNMKVFSMGTNEKADFTMTPQSVDKNGEVTLSVTVDRMEVEMTGLEQLISDAIKRFPGAAKLPGMDDPTGMKALKDALKAVEGESFTARVSRFGEVLAVEGGDALALKAQNAMQAAPNTAAALMKQDIPKELGNDGLQERLQFAFLKVPDKALKPGFSWDNSGTLEMGDVGKLQVKRVVTVTGRNGGLLEMDSTTQDTVDITSPMPGVPASNTPMTGTGKGTLKYDAATGWPRECVETGSLAGPAEVTYKREVHAYPKSASGS